MDKEQVIGKLLEGSSHGTRREDIEAAYSAGATAERELCAVELDSRAESWAGLVRSAMKTAATAMRNGASLLNEEEKV